MGTISYPHTFTQGSQSNASEVNENFAAVSAEVNGSIDVDNLDSSVKAILGVSDGSTVRRGKSIIATEESRTNTAYGTLTTPDRVLNVAVPADGLLMIGASILMKESVVGAARVALFIAANQLKTRTNSAAPQVLEVGTNSSAGTGFYVPIGSTPAGLASTNLGTVTADSSNVTTGQLLGPAADGGVITVEGLPASTYTVSLQFKASSGSVTAKERKLWVWTLGF